MREVSEEQLNDARRTIHRNYYSTVDQWANEYAARAERGEWDSYSDMIDSLGEELDGAADVIYTALAYEVIYTSESAPDALDEIQDVGASPRDPMFVSTWAYYCLRADVLAHGAFPAEDAWDDAP